jgi:hypothetical protein
VRQRALRVAILRACINGDEDAVATLARRGPLDGLTEVAAEQGVAGSLHKYLGILEGLPADERRLLGAMALRNRVDHQTIAADLEYLSGIFRSLPTPWLIVKGPAAAATLYSPPEQRAAGDIDALVAPEHFARAVELLERAGHQIDDANWPLVREMTAGQLHMVLPRGTVLDLHWHLLYEAVERRRHPLTTGELIERRRGFRVGDTELFTLDPVDTLIHLCFHSANEGADRLSWLSDVARAAAAVTGKDWDEVVARTMSWRMQLPVGTVLQRAMHQLGAPVPPDVVSRLLPFSWRTMMSGVDRAFPVAATSRRLGNPASLLARSAAQASTPVRAGVVAISGAGRRALHLAQTGDAGRVDLTNREDSPASLLYPAEFRPDDREAYFAAVGSEAAGSQSR